MHVEIIAEDVMALTIVHNVMQPMLILTEFVFNVNMVVLLAILSILQSASYALGDFTWILESVKLVQTTVKTVIRRQFVLFAGMDISLTTVFVLRDANIHVLPA